MILPGGKKTNNKKKTDFGEKRVHVIATIKIN